MSIELAQLVSFLLAILASSGVTALIYSRFGIGGVWTELCSRADQDGLLVLDWFNRSMVSGFLAAAAFAFSSWIEPTSTWEGILAFGSLALLYRIIPRYAEREFWLKRRHWKLLCLNALGDLVTITIAVATCSNLPRLLTTQ